MTAAVQQRETSQKSDGTISANHNSSGQLLIIVTRNTIYRSEVNVKKKKVSFHFIFFWENTVKKDKDNA